MDDVIVEVHPRGDDDRALLAAVAARLVDGPVRYQCPYCGGTDHGQPRVRGAFVSLARAGDLVAVAATRTGPVGIDIETVDAVAASGFDDVAFTETERRRIALCDEPDLLRATLWTAKEALLKASGTGLRTDPREVDVAEASARIETTQPSPGYVLTVAVLSG
jgi:4'-phosphopantetheinyl transferase